MESDDRMEHTMPGSVSPQAPVPNAGRILCWILTYPKTHENRAVAVNRTWGQRCDILLFMTTELFPTLPVVKLDLGQSEGRDMIWTKTKLSWMHVYERYYTKFALFFWCFRCSIVGWLII